MRITSLEIHTNDINEVKNFYHHHLQFKIAGESGEHITFRLQQGTLTFRLKKASQPVYHIAFNIPNNQVESAALWLRDKTEIIPIDEKNIIADFKNWNAKAIYFFDQQKNIIEFIARRDLDNRSEIEFTSASILSISEVGIVTENVAAAIKDINEKFGIGLFEKQPAHESFAAAGDDEGLFILVSKQRPWFPTGILSSMQWLKIDFIQNGRSYTMEVIEKEQ